VHCGLTITDDSGTYQIDGSGGSINTIIIRPGPGWTKPDDMPPLKPGETGPFRPWGDGGTVFGPPVQHPDKDCQCLRNYFQTFNPLQIPRSHTCSNSNWTLYCMLNHCGLADSATWTKGPPIGFGPKGCCKHWTSNTQYCVEGAVTCQKCDQWWQCPP
jgi:hypothetical protein